MQKDEEDWCVITQWEVMMMMIRIKDNDDSTKEG